MGLGGGAKSITFVPSEIRGLYSVWRDLRGALTLAGRGGGAGAAPPIGFFRDSSEHAGDRELKLGIPDL